MKNSPIRKDPAEEALLALLSSSCQLFCHRDAGKQLVLIIEDDESLASDLNDLLEMEGLQCLLAHSASLGEKLAIIANPEIIILDRLLPDGDGMQVCLTLRTARLECKILMLSGLTQKEEIVGGLDSGADDYLGKPFDFQELLARVKALLARPQSYAHNCLRYAHLTLDLLRNEFIVAGKTIELFPIDKAVLEYFLRRPEKLITANELINAVWRAEEAVSDESLRASILRLRKVTKMEGFPQLIWNKYGAGYILCINAV